MTLQRHTFNHNGVKNIWSKFDLGAAFPLGATQSSANKNYWNFSKSLWGGKSKREKMYIEGRL